MMSSPFLTESPSLKGSFSMGAATREPGERLEAVAKRADLAMFERKRAHYARAVDDIIRATSTAA